MTDRHGIRLDLAAASRHGSALPADTPDNPADLGRMPGAIRVHLDAGYDSQVTRDEPAARNMNGQVTHTAEMTAQHGAIPQGPAGFLWLKPRCRFAEWLPEDRSARPGT
ncbi:MAG: hypothetical protein ACLQDY_27270 [Streptosporangiaceae bacterium]